MDKTVQKYYLSNMTWKDVEEILKKTDIALQVVGACEQHGPHLPMGTDTIEVHELCHRVAQRLREEGIEVLVSEPISFGLSQHHLPFSGTISIKVETLTNLIIDVCESLITHGIDKILLIDGHGSPEQQGCCYNAGYFLQQKYGTTVGVYNGHLNLDQAQILLAKRENNPEIHEKGHAGAGETSLVLASRKGKKHVKMEKAIKVESEIAKKIEEENYIARKGGLILQPTGLRVPAPGPLEFSPVHGHVGDPTKASAEIGNKLYDILADDMVYLVKRMTDISNIPSGERGANKKLN